MSGERKDEKATITEWNEWPEKGDMRAIADRAKEKYTELEHKGWEWRSFYNGWLECFNDCVPYLKGLFHKELIGKLKQRTTYNQRMSIIESQLSKVTEERDRAVNLIERLAQWKDAYPESVFTPVDLDAIADREGVPIDCISAQVLRTATVGWSEEAERLMSSLTEKKS